PSDPGDSVPRVPPAGVTFATVSVAGAFDLRLVAGDVRRDLDEVEDGGELLLRRDEAAALVQRDGEVEAIRFLAAVERSDAVECAEDVREVARAIRPFGHADGLLVRERSIEELAIQAPRVVEIAAAQRAFRRGERGRDVARWRDRRGRVGFGGIGFRGIV